MREKAQLDYQFQFNGSLRVETRSERLSAEGGAVLLREVTERLGMLEWLEEHLVDSRKPSAITHPLKELLMTNTLLLALGWRDGDDADELRDDAALRIAVSGRRGVAPLVTRAEAERACDHNPLVPDGLPSQPTLSRFHQMLSGTENRDTLRDALLEIAARRIRAGRRGHRLRHVTIDVDSLPVEVHGEQPGSKYNGHYHARVYHPLVAAIGETGDLIDLRLREGNVHTAAGALDFILPLLDEAEKRLCQVAAVRIDAGFPDEKVLGGLEERRTPYVARLKNNAVLNRMAEPHLNRPAGRPPTEPRTWLHELSYQASSWSRSRRVVLVVQERWGELFMHHFWLVTDWSAEQMPARDLLEKYRKRGTAEGHLGELMSVLAPALSSSPRSKTHYRGEAPRRRAPAGDSFAINEVLLLMNALAYNVMNAARVLMEEASGRGWSLGGFRERVLRVAGRLVVHGRRLTLVLPQAATRLWRGLLSRLGRLRPVET